MEKKIEMDKASNRYYQSKKGKATRKRYQQSDKGKAVLRRWKQSDKGKAYRLQLSYGLSMEDYNKLFDQQESKCKLCNREFNKEDSHDIRIDHDHKTGKVRGLLCHKCNVALGLFDEDICRLLNAAKYLEESRI